MRSRLFTRTRVAKTMTMTFANSFHLIHAASGSMAKTVVRPVHSRNITSSALMGDQGTLLRSLLNSKARSVTMATSCTHGKLMAKP